MRISVITVVHNGARTIQDCLDSVRQQTHPDVEHIVVDGASSDGTQAILKENADHLASWSSEPDSGPYEAMNKGLSKATGDAIGMLGADDIYASETILEHVASSLRSTGADLCFGDLLYVDPNDLTRTVRTWKTGSYRAGSFRSGWMPPHPTLFVRRAVYEELGYYRATYRIAADYEFMLRAMHVHGATSTYLPEVLVKMRTGGISNRDLRHLVRKSAEDLRAWRENGLSGGYVAVALKNVSKLGQFFPSL